LNLLRSNSLFQTGDRSFETASKKRRFFYRIVEEELLRKELKTAKPKGDEHKGKW